ncbi:hypothetical protein J437_LFUL002390 [Ladona fulva]|uniref:Uncharacterized protein n=1 Tax=Ladona fulva TaxID=123851 RepID=A0A8K0K495_LADFU|nr:hypothetical protein J437_LFUL002390 [Ladona fulva]
MDDSKPKRENLSFRKGSNEREDMSKLNVQQEALMQEYMNEHSGILEGRFYGSFEQEQIESWMKLRDELSKHGPKLTLSECKKVYWDMVSEMKRKKEEKPSTNMSAPRESNYHDDEEVTVIKEERKEKPEAQSRMIRPRLDGRRRYNSSIGEHIGKRKRDSLSPVSSSTLNSNSPFHSKLSSLSPPELRNKNLYRSRSKSPTRPRGSPVRGHYRRSPYRSRHNRSSSQSDRYRKSKSPSRHGKSRSPPRKYGRSRSPTKKGNKSSRSSNTSGKNSHSKYHSKSRSASRERRHRSKSPSSKGNYGNEKKTWEIFRSEVDALEKERWNDEQMYKKNPEKHPEYKVEWKKFYKIRVKELESRGKDPKSYNFESEWAYFWKWKMDELLRKDFEAKKDAIRRKLNLPDDEPKLTHKQKINRFKGAVDESHLSPSDRTQPGSTTKTVNYPGLIPTLRIVTAVEEVLGSLGPQVNGLLSQCVAVQRIEGSNAESLLQSQENFILLETVREKLMGQLQSKIVRKNLVGAVSEAIASIDNLLKCNPSAIFSIPQKYTPAIQPQGLPTVVTSSEEVAVNDLNVPGVGAVDRVAVAQQIAEALVKQGKTDVTEAELQELVNAVLGMAKTQAGMEQSKEAGLALEQNQFTPLSSVLDPLSGFGQVAGSEMDSSLLGNVLAGNALSFDKENSALDLLMSVVQSGAKKSDLRLVSFGYDSDESDSEYSEDKMALKKFTGFKLASKEFKRHFNRGKTERITSGFKVDSAENSTKLKDNFNLSTNRPWEVKSLNNRESETSSRNTHKQLSPFSSRRDNSNPLAADDDKDLKIIGAWDSDSDIDLDATEKTKAPAYEKVTIKSGSEMVIQKPSSSFKSPNASQNKDREISKPSIDTLSIDSAIDDLMGSLRKKSSEKSSSIGEQISIISSSSERLSQAKGGGFSSSQQGTNTNSSYPQPYYPQTIPTHFNQPQQYGTTPAPYNNQYYGSQNAPNYNANPYNTPAYSYSQNNQPVPQNYYGSAGYGQMNTGFPGYNYPPNYTGTQAHSTNYQVPYQ